MGRLFSSLYSGNVFGASVALSSHLVKGKEDWILSVAASPSPG